VTELIREMLSNSFMDFRRKLRRTNFPGWEHPTITIGWEAAQYVPGPKLNILPSVSGYMLEGNLNKLNVVEKGQEQIAVVSRQKDYYAANLAVCYDSRNHNCFVGVGWFFFEAEGLDLQDGIIYSWSNSAIRVQVGEQDYHLVLDHILANSKGDIYNFVQIHDTDVRKDVAPLICRSTEPMDDPILAASFTPIPRNYIFIDIEGRGEKAAGRTYQMPVVASAINVSRGEIIATKCWFFTARKGVKKVDTLESFRSYIKQMSEEGNVIVAKGGVYEYDVINDRFSGEKIKQDAGIIGDEYKIQIFDLQCLPYDKIKVYYRAYLDDKQVLYALEQQERFGMEDAHHWPMLEVLTFKKHWEMTESKVLDLNEEIRYRTKIVEIGPQLRMMDAANSCLKSWFWNKRYHYLVPPYLYYTRQNRNEFLILNRMYRAWALVAGPEFMGQALTHETLWMGLHGKIAENFRGVRPLDCNQFPSQVQVAIYPGQVFEPDYELEEDMCDWGEEYVTVNVDGVVKPETMKRVHHPHFKVPIYDDPGAISKYLLEQRAEQAAIYTVKNSNLFTGVDFAARCKRAHQRSLKRWT
jgi:hypothetical protein